ncbi:MAG TPA: hypothetical protein VK614_10030 [Allosphingosinicella sp.]|nr:hypothetical protein [Allosphingosinicella sp.]
MVDQHSGARVRTAIGRCLLLAVGGLLSACASFTSMPEPFLPPQGTDVPANYYVAKALECFHSPNDTCRNGMSPRQWRDTVVITYMAAADTRYQQFRMGLSREMRGANFGLESSTMVLSAAGTIASQGTANVLAAAVAALTGARASLAREVYFERTIPALGAGMEVARLEVATRILTNLGKSETEYPLEIGILDAFAYGRAPSIDQAIQLVTTQAGAAAAAQHRNYDVAIQNMSGVIVPAARLPQLARVTTQIDGLATGNKTQEMGWVLQGLGLTATGSLEDQAAAANSAVQARARDGTLQAFLDQMKTQHSLELDK